MTLDAVILTHPDSDHMNGLVFILENFRIGTLVTNGDKSAHEAFTRIMTGLCAQTDSGFCSQLRKKTNPV